MPSPSPSLTGLYKALRDRAYECGPDDFQDLLGRFGSDPQALAALEQGLRDREPTEDSGSYCENASRGYAPLMKKFKLVEHFYLATGPFKSRKPVAPPQDPADTAALLRQMQAQMTEMSQRIDQIAFRQAVARPMKPSR